MENLMRYWALLGLTLFVVMSWIWLDKSVWMEINSKLKSLDSRWAFNRPAKMMILDFKDQEAVDQQDRERNESLTRLMDIQTIRKLNSDLLPTRSYFNSTNTVEICEGRDAARCSPGFMPLDNRIRVTRGNQLPSTLDFPDCCAVQHRFIHKSMSTILQAIMCYLSDEHAFESAGRVFSRECTKNRFCFHKNEYSNVFKARKALAARPNRTSIADELRLAIVREPVDRFLSAFVDKCIRKPTNKNYCNGCRSNVTCFVISEYERMMKQGNSGKLVRSFEDRHFFPQAWQVISGLIQRHGFLFRRCNFDTELSSYSFVYYSAWPSDAEDFVGQLNELLEAQGVPFASREFIADQLKRGRTVHSTIESKARQFLEKRIRSSPFLMEFIIRMFYTDYKHFEYRLPEIKFN